jgi:hypothetical protein
MLKFSAAVSRPLSGCPADLFCDTTYRQFGGTRATNGNLWCNLLCPLAQPKTKEILNYIEWIYEFRVLAILDGSFRHGS